MLGVQHAARSGQLTPKKPIEIAGQLAYSSLMSELSFPINSHPRSSQFQSASWMRCDGMWLHASRLQVAYGSLMGARSLTICDILSIRHILLGSFLSSCLLRCVHLHLLAGVQVDGEVNELTVGGHQLLQLCFLCILLCLLLLTTKDRRLLIETFGNSYDYCRVIAMRNPVSSAAHDR